ncbi:hypothetical protein B0H16DRAFT_410523 [Mycena metata]|uniref:MYND-type domain-containing protein n=1 Tax=Mycena metata TaxID=1033252 RepID=A0AAD7HEU6_9AGAR|nr:hypothetical protein B0H16DRAFT_410523 [Mycena metata]
MDATKLNEMAKSHFRDGQYAQAAEKYQAAIAADGRKSALYFSNLAAAYLKLQNFESAQTAAHDALLIDCHSVKARYRRAMARRGLGLLAHSIVDLSSAVITDPLSREVRSAFLETMRMYETPGKHTLGVNELRTIDFPPAHGSVLAAPVTKDLPPPVFSTETREAPSVQSPVFCNGCHMQTLDPEQALYCTKCGTSPYCNAACQRADWPSHKVRCSVLARYKVVMNLADKLGQPDPYFRPLLEMYALRAIGSHVGCGPPCRLVLVVHLGMVPVSGESAHTQRLSVEQISVIPTTILRKQMEQSYDLLLGLGAVTYPGTHMVGLSFCPTMDVDLGPKEPPESFGTTSTIKISPEEVKRRQIPGSSIKLKSRSFGMTREFELDLHILYRAIEDELEMDAGNYYGLRV